MSSGTVHWAHASPNPSTVVAPARKATRILNDPGVYLSMVSFFASFLVRRDAGEKVQL